MRKISFSPSKKRSTKIRLRKPFNTHPRTDTLLRSVYRALDGAEPISDEVFLLVDAVIEKYLTGCTQHDDLLIQKKLQTEIIEKEEIQFLKNFLLAFALKTKHTGHFLKTIAALSKLKDKQLLPFYQTWLSEHVGKVFSHRAVSLALVAALEGCGEQVNSYQWDYTQPNKDLDGARAYLFMKLGLLV